MATMLENAKKFAIKWHGDQKYGDEFPYSVHLQAVESVLLRFGVGSEPLRCVAWLHDVLEDTQAEYEEIALYFGTDVADAVAALTEPKGGNRAWRHSQTYPKIRQNQWARVGKLADRIANVEAGGNLVGMYRKEHAEFRKGIFVNPDCVAEGIDNEGLGDVEMDMWDHLAGLLINTAAAK